MINVRKLLTMCHQCTKIHQGQCNLSLKINLASKMELRDPSLNPLHFSGLSISMILLNFIGIISLWFLFLCILVRQGLFLVSVSPSVYHKIWHFVGAQKYLLSNKFIICWFPRRESTSFYIWSTCRTSKWWY